MTNAREKRTGRARARMGTFSDERGIRVRPLMLRGSWAWACWTQAGASFARVCVRPERGVGTR
jgi:hypothetical protein